MGRFQLGKTEGSMEKVKAYLKSEIVLVLSFLLAAASAFFVTPSAAYIQYIDFRTLALLFCLMAVMEGLKRLGVFRLLAEKLLSRVRTLRGLKLVLCLLCFFSSMLITNDVALLTFVPFTIITLKLSKSTHDMIPLITLETVAANLGSMLTPVGNPQNLYLFSNYEMSVGTFFCAIFPYALLSLVLIVGAALFRGGEKVTAQQQEEKQDVFDIKRCIAYSALFLLAILTVFRVIPYPIMLVICVAAVFFIDRESLKHVDYSLLFTFIFLFVFIGNLGNIPSVNAFLGNVLAGREVPVAILASQIFSNVPAAVLLSGFTADAQALLIGTNLGGLGTLIASMASLISFKFIAKEEVKTGKYLLFFTWVNLVFLAFNLFLWFVLR